MQITLSLPDEIARQLGSDPAEVPRRILEAVALEGYRSAKLSRGQVSELLQLDFWSTESFLKEHGAVLDYSVEDLRNDLAAAKRAAGK